MRAARISDGMPGVGRLEFQSRAHLFIGKRIPGDSILSVIFADTTAADELCESLVS
jgi:hypothetical protein